MATYGAGGYKYTEATELLVSGYGMTYHGTPVEREVIVATAKTEIPVGVTLQSCKQNDHVGLSEPGMLVKAVAGGAITVGALVTVTTAGKFVAAVPAAGTITNDYVWGWAESAAGGANDIFSLRFQPQHLDQTA